MWSVFLDLGLPVPRWVLLLLLLLRGRGRAGGQAVQHLPDVEFPHGRGRAPRTPGAEVRGVPQAGGEPARAESSFDRGRRGGRREWGVRGRRQLGRSEEIIRTGNAAATRERSGDQKPAGDPSRSEDAACSRRRRRRLAPRPGGTAVAAAPHEPAPPSLTWRRADSAPRRRPGSPRRRRVHGQRLRRSSPTPGPAVPQRFLPLRISRLLLTSSRGRRLSAFATLGLLAAQRRCPPGIARRAPGWVPALSAWLLRGWFGPPSLAPSEPRLPSSGTAVAAARGPARPLPPRLTRAPPAQGTNARSEQQRQPAVTALAAAVAAAGPRRSRAAERMSPRVPTPSAVGVELGLKLSSAKIPDRG